MNQATILSTEQLIAFNDELRALVRAGVPLERGLLALRGDQAGTLGTFAGEVGARLERGEELAQVVADEQSKLPALYRAVVCAGLRSNRLAVALEGLTNTLRRVADLKRLMRTAAAYPLLVVIVSYLLFLFALRRLIPGLLETYNSFDVPPTISTRVLSLMHDNVAWWWPWPPLLLTAWLLWTWWRARSDAGQSRRLSILGSMYRNGRLLTFSDLLALLIEHNVPLPEAVELAAAASGDTQLSVTGRAFAADLRQGIAQPPQSFPPLVGYVLTAANSQTIMVTSLRKLAALYERRARRDADWLRLYLPALLTVVIGGGAAALSILAFLGPWFHILKVLSGPEYGGAL